MIKLDNTKKFYDEIKTMGFFKRVFSWGKIIALLTESYAEINKIEDLVDEKTKIESDLKSANQSIDISKDQIAELKGKIKSLEEKRDSQVDEIKELSNDVSKFKKGEEKQAEEHIATIGKLQKSTEDFDTRRQQLEDEQVEKEKQRFEEMAKTWRNHEDLVEQSMKQICSKYTMDYYDKEKVPFKGKPDNAVKIANEFIIFDAKSPQKDDLNNFPKYIKAQSESIKKYVQETDVKKDLFLVVPTNTMQVIDTTFYDQSDYRVYVITIDSLEPILLSLRKIEEYEFAEKLSPEDRESICRVIGHFAHHTKRRLQIDTFLANKSLELLKSCDYLPEDILDEVKNHELKTIINVPMDKRSKKNDLKKLKTDKKKLTKELEIQHINTKVGAKKLESIELYSKEDEE
jgi:hypothetical protein